MEQALRQGQTDVSVLTSVYRDRALERGGLRLLFSDLVGRAIDWSRDTPREQVLERFRTIIAKRKRNEDASIIKYGHSYGIGTPKGRIQDEDFSIWIDWMVRSGELRRGQLNVPSVYTNELNAPEQKRKRAATVRSGATPEQDALEGVEERPYVRQLGR